MANMAEIAEFSFSYDGAVKLLLPKGKRARIEVSDHDFYVHFGRGFETRFPLSSVRQIGPIPAEWVGITRGVHGGHGAWLVNGSNRGLIRLILDPPAVASTTLGSVVGAATHTATTGSGGVEVRELRLSVEDPDGLIERVRAATGVS